MRTVFMVAEKPSLAQSISQILSRGQLSSRKGFNGACSVHDWVGKLKQETVRFRMTSVCGHVMSLDFQSRYNNWDKTDPAELFAAETLQKEATANLHMPAFLEKEAKGTDVLVLWLDCDKEGENICFEVIDCVQNVMNRSNRKEIFRAKFSAITDKEIVHAMDNLILPNKLEALSVDARQELDLRIGCAFTRFQTKFFQGKYGNLDSRLISYGPCQTPTLGFCVDRHDRIQSFTHETFWKLKVTIVIDDIQKAQLDWERVRLFDREVAQLFLLAVKDVKYAVITNIVAKQKTKARPQALNTVELMRIASSALGIGPQAAMAIAERLYTQGYISYPRTETTQYPESFNLKEALKIQSNHPNWGGVVQEILRDGLNKPKKGHDAGDHPPITPMRMATSGEMSHEAWRLYEYITTHFLSTLMADCLYEQTTVSLSIGESEKFSFVGRRVLDPGYTRLMQRQDVEDVPLPAGLVVGQKCAVDEVRLDEGQTSPPDYLTESELITLMEKHGIGTDASIAVHINNICERNYVQVTTGRRLQPTPLGIVLVHGYQKIDPELVLPHMRSAVEEQLNLISRGEADYRAVTRHAIDIFYAKFRYFVEHVTGMDELFEVTFSSLADSGKPLSRCGKCLRYMKLVSAKPQRLHCAMCNETYALPQNGTIRLYKELKCPLDEFELVLWTQGGKGKSFPLCPYCFTHPPFEDMLKGMGCNECSHPTCSQAFDAKGVDACIECQVGVLVLDESTPPKYRLNCNKCDVVVAVSDAVRHLSIANGSCDKCSAINLSLKLDPNKAVGDNMTEFTGCVFCSDTLSTMFEAGRAKSGRRGGGGGGRGRGRGRGRGGRR